MLCITAIAPSCQAGSSDAIAAFMAKSLLSWVNPDFGKASAEVRSAAYSEYVTSSNGTIMFMPSLPPPRLMQTSAL